MGKKERTLACIHSQHTCWHLLTMAFACYNLCTYRHTSSQTHRLYSLYSISFAMFPMQFKDSSCLLSAALFELKTVGANPVHQSIAPIASSVIKSWPCKSTIWGASGPSKAKSSVERPNFSSTSSRSFAQRFWSLGASVLQISRRERAQLPMKLSFVKSSPNKSDGAWLSWVKNVRRSSAKSSSCHKAERRTCRVSTSALRWKEISENTSLKTDLDIHQASTLLQIVTHVLCVTYGHIRTLSTVATF